MATTWKSKHQKLIKKIISQIIEKRNLRVWIKNYLWTNIDLTFEYRNILVNEIGNSNIKKTHERK